MLIDEPLNFLESSDDALLLSCPTGAPLPLDFNAEFPKDCLLYTSPSPRDVEFPKEGFILLGELSHGSPRPSCGREMPRPQPCVAPKHPLT